jgi:glyoxylase-like metal-dependent hydrolase (beta-lactamase superfamily II)
MMFTQIRNPSMRRRTLLLAAPALSAGCAAPDAATDPPPPPAPPPVTVTTPGGLRLHAFQTGWVRVKARHRRLDGPAALRLPAILLDSAWTPWLPILCYAIEHPEGVLVVDTGETARATEPDYFACSRGDAFFYGRNLRFAVRPEEEIGAQLRAVGIAPERVRWVAMTHLHSDHMGGMGSFPHSRFLLSRGDALGHLGALTCRIPEGLTREAVDHDGPAIGAFAASRTVTRDGALRLVPTPGHSPAHQSVLLQEGEWHWLFAGDAAFDLDQVERQEAAGIVADVPAARETLGRLQRQLALAPTLLLPAHDPGAPARLRSGHAG